MTNKKMKHLWMVEDTDRDGVKKSYWTKIGVAFECRDGSWNIELAAIPVNGKLQMRDPAPPRVDGVSSDDTKNAAAIQ